MTTSPREVQDACAEMHTCPWRAAVRQQRRLYSFLGLVVAGLVILAGQAAISTVRLDADLRALSRRGGDAATAGAASPALPKPGPTAVSGPAPSPDSGACSRVRLDPPPARVGAALWVDARGAILLVDTLRNALSIYAPDGKGILAAERPGDDPSLLASVGPHVYVEVLERRVVELDPSALPGIGAESSRKYRIGSAVPTLLQWTGLGGSTLAVGLRLAEEGRAAAEVQAGLFRLPALSARSADLVLPLASDAWYGLGYSCLTSIGRRGYFLDLDGGRARVYEVGERGGGRWLPAGVPSNAAAAYAADFSEVPAVDLRMGGPLGAASVYARLRGLKMAAGLYGSSDGKLYLLARAPAPAGTNWWLFRLDPFRGDVEGKALLPTHVPFVSVVAAPSSFYVFEEGEPSISGYQETPTLLRVPGSLLERAPLQGVEVCAAFDTPVRGVRGSG